MNLIDKFYEIQGKTIKEFKLFGIPVFTLSQTKPNHFNFFVFCFPLLRFNKKGTGYTPHLLLLVWIAKALLKPFQPVIRKRKYESYVKNAIPRYLKPEYNKKLQKKLKKNHKLKVVLFESRIACFQYEELYRLLKESPYFSPVIVVKPFVYQGHDVMVNLMEETYSILKKRGYKVVKGYEKRKNKFLNVKKELRPDAVFYSMYWEPHFEKSFYINSFEDIHSFLFAYGFDVASHPQNESMNFELQNKVTRYYLPTKLHKTIAIENMDNLGANTYVTGSPKLDLFIDSSYNPVDVWKPQDKPKKRIIWAPHHSDGFKKNYYQFNAFYEIFDFMIEMAEKYKDQVQFAFKPHPMLKPKLDTRWGKAEADRYYAKWREMENTQLEEGEFKDLFLGSDAMILDSISFIAEYTITDKPAFFTIGKTSRVNLNTYGAENFKVLYKPEGDLKSSIEKYIVDVVIGGNDYMKKNRERFIKQYMLPPHGKSASQNIYDDMVNIMVNGQYETKG